MAACGASACMSVLATVAPGIAPKHILWLVDYILSWTGRDFYTSAGMTSSASCSSCGSLRTTCRSASW